MKKIALILSTLFIANVYADAIEDTCKQDQAVCSCAAEKFKKGLKEDDYNFFLSVSDDFLSIKAEGIGVEDSWDIATKDAVTDTSGDLIAISTKVDKLKKRFSSSIKACGG